MATQTTTLPIRVAQARTLTVLPALSLWWREIVRFYRQRTRVVGVILSPLLFWIVIGSGFGTSFRSGGAGAEQHYLEYFYPGALIMIVLFTSIFTMMSVIEDRREGFLLSVLVAPVRRSAIVLGKVLGGATLAAIQRQHRYLGRLFFDEKERHTIVDLNLNNAGVKMRSRHGA